jgi:hypothetical protein
MSRQKLTLRLDSAVIKQAKLHGMNLSGFLEIKLVEYLLKKQDGLSRARHVLLEGLLWIAPHFWGQLKVQSYLTLKFSFFFII